VAQAVPVRVRRSAPYLARKHAANSLEIWPVIGGHAVTESSDAALPPLLSEENPLVFSNGVWTDSNSRAGLDYSDGKVQERELGRILHEAPDRRWDAAGLAQNHNDWALDYHLSPLRANILRGLMLKNRKTVLEVGAGCGAITRYLGDQGFRVDAVEGSAARAQLAALRCHGLEDVSVVRANINDLILPAATYDLVLFVGVLEYAARFWGDDSSAEFAVQKMLSQAVASLAPGGVILVAIENRIGAKYLCGFSEDHLGRPWAGVAGYPTVLGVDAGIRTFDSTQWAKLLESMTLKHRFFYPLPDYKLPEALISEGAAMAPGALAIADRFGPVSRSGGASGTAPVRLQQAAFHDACLDEYFADSFGIVIGVASDVVEEVLAHQWVVFDQPWAGQPQGLCLRVDEKAPRSFAGQSRQKSLLSLPSGEPLLRFWLRYAAAASDQEGLIQLIAAHYRQVRDQGLTHNAGSLLVDHGGQLLSEPFPWPDDLSLSQSSDCTSWLEDALERFLVYGGADLRFFPASKDLNSSAALVEQVLEAVRNNDQFSSAGNEEERAPYIGAESSATDLTHVAIYWAGMEEEFSEERSKSQSCRLEGRQRLKLALSHNGDRIGRLRFDPSNHSPRFLPNQLVLEVLTIYIEDTEDEIDLLQAFSLSECESNDLQITRENDQIQLQVLGADPWLTFDLSLLGGKLISHPARVEAVMLWIA
jgi:SAM-dependent methyltransferase